MPRYTTSGLPPVTQRGPTAFLPHFNRMAASGAQQYKDGVTGLPGTAAMPIGNLGVPSPDIGDFALSGRSTTADAPGAIWPNLYYVLPERNYRPGLLIQMYDPTAPELTTMIPVPATSLRQTYIRKAATLSMGITGTGTDPAGQKQVRQPLSGVVRWARRQMGNGVPSG